MGYTTSFDGKFTVAPALKPEHRAYLSKFRETRRMQRDAAKTAAMPDPIRQAVGLPVGDEGGYFVGGGGYYGQEHTPDIIDYNREPTGQPSLWCQWEPSADGTSIVWDEGEKFYSYREWLEYLIAHFLMPWGYAVNGAVAWQGEDPTDAGALICKDNVVTTRKGHAAAKRAKAGKF